MALSPFQSLLIPFATQFIGQALGTGTQAADSGFSINEFMQNIEQNDEVAFTDMFNVTINLPQTIDQTYGSRQLALTCESAEFPGVEINTVQYRHYGFNRYLPRTLQYSPLVLTFYVTGGMREKMVFDSWIDACVGIDGNGQGLIQYRQDNNGLSNYEADITINQYDRAGNLTYWAQAIDAFPTSINALNTNWSDNSPHRLTVTFMFTKWLTDAFNPNGSQFSPVVTNYTNQTTQQFINQGQNFLNNSSIINPFLKVI